MCVIALPAHAGERSPEECFQAAVAKRKTSLGVHQWTAGLRVRWCAAEGRVRAVRREARVRTGTNWQLVSKRVTERGGRRAATVVAGFHFRLRYPQFEQNCYPRLAIHVTGGGESRIRRRTGC